MPAGIFNDRTYISTAAKMNACLQLAIKQPDVVFIAWFSDTASKFKACFIQQGVEEQRIMEARHVHSAMLQNKIPVFCEHYPLHEKEMELVRNWPQKEFVVYSAMDEPLFKHFGSEKMIPLMKMLGMKEEEAIEHAMVSKSIIKAQEKIATLVTLDQSADSQERWMEKNIPKKS